MRKVLFVATVAKAHIMAFHLPSLKMLQEDGFETHVCASNDTGNEQCEIPSCDIYHNVPFSRSPFSLTNIKAYRKLRKILKDNYFDLIHCHTPVGGIITRLAARSTRKSGTKVLYTAHGFHFFKGAPMLNWLLYYPVEKFCSRFTDVLITISKEDYALAQKKMKAKRVEYIPGVGVDVEKFANVEIDRNAKRQELGVGPKDVMLLSVGELSKRKNHQVVIRALAKLNNPYVHYYIAGQGELKNYLLALTKELHIEDQVHLLGFRSDIPELLKSADISVLPSLQEGLPVALMEAMAAGLPCIVSRIRGNTDLIEDRVGGYCVNPSDVNEYKASMEKILTSGQNEQMSENNVKAVQEFGISIAKEKMQKLYDMIVME